MFDNLCPQDQPPSELIDYYIWAEFCNNILASLNDLRLCAPLPLVESVTSTLQQCLCSATQLLSLFQRQEQQALSPQEKESLSRLCAVFATKFIPHVQRCLHAVFRPEELELYIGIDKSQLEKEVGLVFHRKTYFICM